MNRVTITLGTGEDRDGAPLDPALVESALAAIRVRFAALGGFTETETLGGWLHDGQLATEPGRRFVLITEADGAQLAREAARALHQHSALLEVEPVNAQLIEA